MLLALQRTVMVHVVEEPVEATTVADVLLGAIDLGVELVDPAPQPAGGVLCIARIGQRLAKARAVRELRHDNAVLDARVVTRSIELGEMRAAFAKSESERQRLAALMRVPD